MNKTWRVGDWNVNAAEGWLCPRRRIKACRIYPDGRIMSVFGILIANSGKLVSTEQILAETWSDRVVSRDSVSTAIYQLRLLLGDDSATPSYIRTEPRRGYRLIAPVCIRNSRLRTRPVAAALAAGVVLSALVVADRFELNAPASRDLQQVFVAPLEDSTGGPAKNSLYLAMDATLFGALVRRNPGSIAARLENDASPFRLESQIVACETGPALVVRLLDVDKRRYTWSKTYSFDDEFPDRSLVEFVAREVSAIL